MIASHIESHARKGSAMAALVHSLTTNLVCIYPNFFFYFYTSPQWL